MKKALILSLFVSLIILFVGSTSNVLADDGSIESLGQGSTDWGSSQSDGSIESLGQGSLDSGSSQSDGSIESLGQGPLTSSCSPVFQYSECTWTGPGIVHEVFKDCNGNFSVGRTLFQPGVCGDTSTSQTSCSPVFQYSECTWTGPGIVQEVFQDCNSNYKAGPPIFQAGVCGDTARASQPQPTPASVPACNFKFVNTECDNSGSGFVHDVFINCLNNVQFRNVRFIRGTCGDVVAIQPTPIQSGPASTPPVVINPTPGQGGTVVTADQRCPSGTDFGGIVDSNIICVQQTQNQSQVVTNNATASTGAVNINLTGGSTARTVTTPVTGQTIVTSVPGKTFVAADTELPKTGVPLVAWAFPGLLPLGLRLRKFGSVNSIKGTSKSLASYLWQKREFDK